MPDNTDDPRTAKRRQRILGILGTTVAVVGVFIAWQQYERAQRVFAMTEIVARWNDNTSDLKNTIEAQYPGLYNRDFFDLLNKSQAQALFDATEASDAALFGVRQGIVELLNYFEYIALTCHTGVADETIVREFAGGAMKRWNIALAEFVHIYNEERGSCVWGPYYSLMEAWGADPIQCG